MENRTRYTFYIKKTFWETLNSTQDIILSRSTNTILFKMQQNLVVERVKFFP